MNCKRRLISPNTQQMADLLAEKVIANQLVFYNVGLDCFDPIKVKSGRSSHKRYGIIFTCQASRAMHWIYAIPWTHHLLSMRSASL